MTPFAYMDYRKNNIIINLHMHSNESGGEYSYEEIILSSYECKYDIISITDHDSLEVQEKAIEYSKEVNIKYIISVEISALYYGREVHILAYFRDLPPKEFNEYIRSQAIIKEISNKRKNKKSCGSKITNVEDIVARVHQFGGIAILAHPIYYNDILEPLLKLTDGLELLHPDHSLAFINYLIKKYGGNKIMFTCGTDLYEGNPENIPYMILAERLHEFFLPFIKSIT